MTARTLRAEEKIEKVRRNPKEWLVLTGAQGHNLVGIDVRFPVSAMTCVTGVSGSGKSSLVLQTLLPALQRHFGLKSETLPLPFADLQGMEFVQGVLGVNQTPLGRTSRGNPSTYLKIWDIFRKRFSSQPLAQKRGYKPGFFSFNVAGGRCEACRGDGAETVEMQFLADVIFSCIECGGRRFVGAVLEVDYLGYNVSDVLQLTVQEAVDHYASDTSLIRALQPLIDVGLGYIRLGQPLNTLSGGEAQRLKLAEALLRAIPDRS